MDRDYANGIQSDDAEFFIGLEVEHTSAYGLKTLFVTGIQDPVTILSLAKGHQVKHIYFGANQSFPKLTTQDTDRWIPWKMMIKTCLEKDYWCTLDFDISCAESVIESELNEYRKFISMISVKLPNLTKFNYHATIKLDDKDFEATNPGVWTHRLHDLLENEKFTDWDQYKDDEITQ